MKSYRKAIVGIATALATFLTQITSIVSASEKPLFTIVVAFVGAFLVYLAPNAS